MALPSISILDVIDFLGLSDVWRIRRGGSWAIEFDSFLAIEFRDPSRLSTFPQEAGAFASYNKVETPFDIRVTLTRGGADSDRSDFIATLYKMKKSIDLYDIITPEATYINTNLENYTYRRTSKSGKTMITAELFFKEVRITSGASNYNPSQPSSASPSSGGQVSPESVSGPVASSIPSVS